MKTNIYTPNDSSFYKQAPNNDHGIHNLFKSSIYDLMLLLISFLKNGIHSIERYLP